MGSLRRHDHRIGHLRHSVVERRRPASHLLLSHDSDHHHLGPRLLCHGIRPGIYLQLCQRPRPPQARPRHPPRRLPSSFLGSLRRLGHHHTYPGSRAQLAGWH
ncbi:hypothetical protein FOPG_19992 [Fusarium oxysporum f. sp. conglutinans race 2 54008]|uniref:Uncharacterized protein n=1 Tax=Fusarium oxysporum f. sp. conglutinans race 2 54008 TaxID=1089457 RepID=X0GV00_FUSOX|nr:hypothetical protein FOPG_19992 [Fusarium oxysporum f. sp. conglutinans race 2 54008]